MWNPADHERNPWLPERSLKFGAATSDRVDFGSGASIDAFVANTVLIWVFPTSVAANKRLAVKETAGQKQWTLRAGGQVGMDFDTDGTDAALRGATTAPNILTVNKWWFLAMTLTLDTILIPQAFLGDFDRPATEIAYATQTTGSGTLIDESAGSFLLGNGASFALALVGRIAWFSYHNAALTLPEIRAQQYRPHVVPSMKLCSDPRGFSGIGTELDFSGNGNNGTSTGATLETGPAHYIEMQRPRGMAVAAPAPPVLERGRTVTVCG